MTEQQVIGFSALAIIVVGMVVYRVVWFIRREKRRNSGVVWFKTGNPK
jgi:membrane protein DedA with SNARE-associated domain